MRILLIGGTGQVGSEVFSAFNKNKIECISPSSKELDITDNRKIEATISNNLPLDFVINASAYTAVDLAEDESDLAFAINRDGPQFLAQSCSKHGIPLLHISTDYVFDGSALKPYVEEMEVSPLGIYGKSKADGEQAIRQCLPAHIILRTAWVYGANGNNFVKTMLRLGQKHSELRVVGDQAGCPTSAVDIADTIIKLVKQMQGTSKSDERWGTYHYCSAGSTSWAEFAKKIFSAARKIMPSYPVTEVISIATSEYPTKATRPKYSVLDCRKITSTFAINAPLWSASLLRDSPNVLKNI